VEAPLLWGNKQSVRRLKTGGRKSIKGAFVKNRSKQFRAQWIQCVIIAAMLAVGFSIMACGARTTLQIRSQQVYLMPTKGGDWQTFGGNLAVYCNLGGSGSISEGRLSFSIGEPDAAALESISSLPLFRNAGDIWNDLAFSDPNVGAAYLSLDTPEGILRRAFILETETDLMREYVDWVFVERDVTVTGSGMAGDGYAVPALNLRLRRGWNTIHHRMDIGERGIGGQMSLGDPRHINWALEAQESEW